MNLEFEKSGRVLVVALLDRRLDADAAEDLKERVAEHVGRGERQLVLDLSDVEFVDSTGLGALVSLLRRVAGDGGNLVLCACRPGVTELLRLTRLNRVFQSYDTRAAATAALA